MSEFSEQELHDLVDRALGNSEPYQPSQSREVNFPQLSYLEINLIEQFYSLLNEKGIDSSIRSEIIKDLKGTILNSEHSKLSLTNLRNKIVNCTKCVEATDRSKSMLGNIVDPKILFVLASPNNDLNKLTDYLDKFDFDKATCGLTYVTRCPLAANITESVINNCSDYLFSEIDYLAPEILVPVGAIPLKVLVGKTHNLTDSHGKLFWLGIFRVFPLFSPMYADKANKQSTLEIDLETLRQLSHE